MTDQGGKRPKPQETKQREPAPRQSGDWRGIAEERIQEAQRNGDFKNLKGKGQPLRLEQNFYAGDRALAYSLLKSNAVAPPEIERGKEIDAELARTEEMLAHLRRQRDALRVRTGHAFASERRAYNIVHEKTATRYAEALRGLNSRILSLNIIAPPSLHRRLIDVEARLRAFEDEFPRLKE
jgi:hypothetical protein